MKVSYVLLLALVAVVTADSSYENYENNYPQQEHYENNYPEQEHSNYYSNRRNQPARKEGLLGTVRRFFGLGASRRQYSGQGNGYSGAGNGYGDPAASDDGGFPLLPVVLGGLGLAALAGLLGAIFLATQLNNSGRGLDTDEWEVDHSVWMDQLQKDFEDSWSQA